MTRHTGTSEQRTTLICRKCSGKRRIVVVTYSFESITESLINEGNVSDEVLVRNHREKVKPRISRCVIEHVQCPDCGSKQFE